MGLRNQAFPRGELPEPQWWLRLLPTVQGRDSKDGEWSGSTSAGCAQDGIVKSASRITGLRTPDHGAHSESVASWSLEGRMTCRQHGTVMRVGQGRAWVLDNESVNACAYVFTVFFGRLRSGP